MTIVGSSMVISSLMAVASPVTGIFCAELIRTSRGLVLGPVGEIRSLSMIPGRVAVQYVHKTSKDCISRSWGSLAAHSRSEFNHNAL